MHGITHNTDTRKRDVGRCKFAAIFSTLYSIFLLLKPQIVEMCKSI